MVKFVEDELKKIRMEVFDMWTLVDEQLRTVFEAVETGDKEKAWDVILREKRVNASDLKLDCDVEEFLVLYNPVAIDLRFLLAMYKINADLERIGDFAENIARFVIKNSDKPLDAELMKKLRYSEMTARVLEMMTVSKEALMKEDLELANSVFAMDNLVDDINAEVTNVLADYVKANPDMMTFALNLKGVFLRIERAGDHITNMAEEIVFYIDAEVLKHSSEENKTDRAMLNKKNA